jgi:hypothetical protein
MVFTFNATQNILDPNVKQLMYDYFSVLVYKSTSQYITAKDASGATIPQYLTSQYKPASTSPNVTYPDKTITYAASNIYLQGLVHNNILDVTCNKNGELTNREIVGELIIENTKLTGSGKSYLCFLLAADGTLPYLSITSNDIDRIISMVSTPSTDTGLNISTTLNGVLPVQNSAVTYTEGSNTIFVFTTPVYINGSSADIIKHCLTTTTLFKNAPSDNATYSSLNSDNIKQKGIDDIYIDCQPTGESAETISTYQVPVNSEYTKDASKIDLYKTAVQLCIVFSFLAVSYFAVPTVYKMLIIDNVNRFVLNPKDPNNNQAAIDAIINNRYSPNSQEYIKEMKEAGEDVPKTGIDTFVRIASIDFWIFIFAMIMFVLILTQGFSPDLDPLSGVYFMIFFVMGYANVKFSKISAAYMQSRVDGKIVGNGYPAESVKGVSINFFDPMDIFFGLFKDFGTFVTRSTTAQYVLLFWFIGTAVLQGAVWGVNATNPLAMPKNMALLLSMALEIVILLGSPVAVLSNITREDFYNKSVAATPGQGAGACQIPGKK